MGSTSPGDPGNRAASDTASADPGASEHEMARLPDHNPNPVLLLSEDGRIAYANPASGELLGLLEVQVGARLPDAEWSAVLEALAVAPIGQAARPVEVVRSSRTFVLVAVRISEVTEINVYVSEITAQRAVTKFPDENPNPVLRVALDGTLIYANAASRALIDGIGCRVGAMLPEHLRNPILVRSRDGGRTMVEAESGDRLYALLPVAVPEFGFINVYGTDITAARQLERLHRENERLLLNILPEPIANRLRAGETMIADRFEDVTLMFADIVGFTELSSRMSPDELVGVLNEVFTVFDLLADEYRLEKVKTIGDAYMIVGGLPEPTDDHLDRVARMALDLANAVTAIGSADRLGIRFRVGIHVGPVVAGVIGRKKFIYDVWGDTVNVASRMESHGVSGRIQVSGAVEQRLRGRFTFEERGLVDLKGKGPTPTWFLVGRAGADAGVRQDRAIQAQLPGRPG